MVTLVEAAEGLGAGPAVRVGLDEGEHVARGVAGPVEGHVEPVVELRVLLALDTDVEGGDAGDAAAAVDADVLGAEAVRGLAEEGDGEQQPVVTDLDRVNSVELGGPYLGAAGHGGDGGHAAALPSKTSSARVPVARRTYDR